MFNQYVRRQQNQSAYVRIFNSISKQARFYNPPCEQPRSETCSWSSKRGEHVQCHCVCSRSVLSKLGNGAECYFSFCREIRQRFHPVETYLTGGRGTLVTFRLRGDSCETALLWINSYGLLSYRRFARVFRPWPRRANIVRGERSRTRLHRCV